MLFDSTEHETLLSHPWNADQAQSMIINIVHGAESTFDPRSFWSRPPEADAEAKLPALSLYDGAAGDLWALLFLQDSGSIPKLPRDYRPSLADAHATYLQSPDTDSVAPGYLFGECGILSVQARFAPSPDVDRRLHVAALGALERPENELMWAAPGAMIAALFAHERTKDPKWNEVISQGIHRLLQKWIHEEELGARIWIQDLYGSRRKFLGAVHGFGGNTYALLRCLEFADALTRKVILDESRKTLLATAHVEGDAANWLPVFGGQNRSFLTQWCHGAPGMITSFSSYPLGDEAIDRILVQAGNLVWQAGPLQNPSGLCHGNAGNGYAFLKLFKRTGDEKWLHHARAFAMHAIHQANQRKKKVGSFRPGLLTGDLGLALYLRACIEPDERWPLLDMI